MPLRSAKAYRRHFETAYTRHVVTKVRRTVVPPPPTAHSCNGIEMLKRMNSSYQFKIFDCIHTRNIQF